MDVSTGPTPEVDLTPRQPPPARKQRRWGGLIVIVAVLAGLGFIATKALSDASLFFYNADEAVAKKDELMGKRFRLQGTVEDGTITQSGNDVEFTVVFNGVEVPVVHQGDPPELFKAGTPVVLEGRWDPSGQMFDSDRMLIKHDEQYQERNADRLKEAQQGGAQPVSTTTAPPSP